MRLAKGSTEDGISRPEAACMAPSTRAAGGRRAAAPALPPLLARLKQSVWAPVMVKTVGIGLGMLALAGIGVASTSAGPAHIAITQSALASAARFDAEPATPGPSPPETPATASKLPTSDGGAPVDRIILNQASAEELTRLPGVGQKRAEAIVALRTRLGGFKRLTDLLRIRGIGPRSLKRMLPYLTLDPPKALADGGHDGGRTVSNRDHAQVLFK
jgi:competence protein ComEA